MKLLTIDLDTNNLSATRTFYTQRLGLPIIAESTNSFTLQVGWTQLTFRSAIKSVAPYHFAINVPAGMLELCMHWFAFDYLDTQACGQTIAEFRDWRARSAYFFDNNGNILEFITRHDLPLADSNMTMGDLFQGISEIGITTSCVTSTIHQLSEQYGVTCFCKSRPMPDFAALGDDNGLFIVSKVSRKWLFTDIPAASNKYRVTFQLKADSPVQTLRSDEQGQLPVMASSDFSRSTIS